MIELVHVVDGVLDFLERNPEFRSFTLDCQTVRIEEYLRIRPENEKRIRILLESGRLFIGPWYVRTHPVLVSGEALIRNLLAGKRTGESLGGLLGVECCSDSFGHISQMPQILRGFGMEVVVQCGGEVGEDEIGNTEPSEYCWESPDASSVLFIRLFSFAGNALRPTRFDRRTVPLFANRIPTAKGRSRTPCFLWIHGGESTLPDADVLQKIRLLNPQLKGRCVHSTLEELVSRAKKSDPEKFPKLKGELCDTRRRCVCSTRVGLKQRNEDAQMRLERVAEPLHVLSLWEGFLSQKVFLDSAWRLLLLNHSADSIGGCSTDAVGREMEVRFEQCQDIIEAVCKHVLKQLAGSKPITESSAGFVVFNLSPSIRDGLVEVPIAFPCPVAADQKSTQGRPSEKRFRILDGKGRSVPFQILKKETVDFSGGSVAVRPWTLLVHGKKLPSMGFRKYRIEEAETFPLFPNRVHVGRDCIENRWIRVHLKPNGAVSVLDKVRNQRYEGLNLFEDGGDVGDLVTYCRPENDRIFLSKSFPHRISVVEEGPLRGAIRMRVRMKVPAQAAKNRRDRSAQEGMIKIWSTVTLDCNFPRVLFFTEIENRAKDHRLRVLFPTGCQTLESFAGTPFHAVRREHSNGDSRDPHKEVPSIHPMQGFVAVFDAKRGVGLFVRGLYEYELKLDNQRTLALTLLRSVGRLPQPGRQVETEEQTGGFIQTPEAQGLGKYAFHYALVFHDPKVPNDFSHLYREWENFRLPLWSYTACCEDIQKKEQSWLRVEPDMLVFSTLKESENRKGFVLRLLNPTSSIVEGRVIFERPVSEVWECRLDEEHVRKLIVRGKKVEVAVAPWQIYTLCIVPHHAEGSANA